VKILVPPTPTPQRRRSAVKEIRTQTETEVGIKVETVEGVEVNVMNCPKIGLNSGLLYAIYSRIPDLLV
jgi:hypothetical protein